jgi:hypothetical protein
VHRRDATAIVIGCDFNEISVWELRYEIELFSVANTFIVVTIGVLMGSKAEPKLGVSCV